MTTRIGNHITAQLCAPMRSYTSLLHDVTN